jgi:site-specific recombinase XerD
MQTTNYLQAKESFFLSAQVEGKSRRTLELYEETLKKFELFLKDKDLLCANSTDIRQFLFSLEKQGFAKATLYTHHKELRVFYNFLLNEGYISENPMKGIKPPKMPRVYPYVLSEEDVEKLLRATRKNSFEGKRDYAILLTFIDTGIRVSELINLSIDDVSLAIYTMKVRGKGDRERVVYFSKDTAKAISAYIKTRGFIAYEDSFFVSRSEEPMNRNSVLQMLKRLAKRAKIKDKRVSPHTFRHTSATFWIKNGGDTVSLRTQLGHVDTRMVDVYVNLVGKDLRDAHRKYSPVSRLLIKKRG